MIVGKSEELEPIFGKIIHVLLIDASAVKLIIHVWTTEGFSRHLHAYVVTPTDPAEASALGIDDLLDFSPLHATKSYLPGHTWYISPKYKIA